MAVWLFIYWGGLLSCHADASCLLGSVWLLSSGRTCFSCTFSPLSLSQKAQRAVHVWCVTELRGWWIPVDSHLRSVFPTWSWLVSLSFIHFISCSLPVTLSGVCVKSLDLSWSLVWRNVQRPWFLYTLGVYKMDLWNDNQISQPLLSFTFCQLQCWEPDFLESVVIYIFKRFF